MASQRCGVCHSDLHLQDGYFSLGDKKLDVSAGRTLPFTLGHEIAGLIESVGADAHAAIVGRRVAVYPWIGCGICAAKRICARTIATSASPSTAASLPTFWFRISATCLLRAAVRELRRAAHVLGAYRLRRAQTLYETAPSAARSCSSVSAASGPRALPSAARFSRRRRLSPISMLRSVERRRGRRRAGHDPSDPQARSGDERDRRRIAGDLRFRWLRQIAAIRHRPAGARRQGRGDRNLLGWELSIAAAMFGIKAMTDPKERDRHAPRGGARVARFGASEEHRSDTQPPLGEAQAALDGLCCG